MNHKKRFELRSPEIDYTIQCEEISDNGEWITYGEIVDLLNENEQLKQDNLLLIDDSEKYRKLSIQFDNRNKELISENEQLKKELANFKEWEKHIGNVKREELDRVFKMSIYEIAEAFEYYKERIEKLGKRFTECEYYLHSDNIDSLGYCGNPIRHKKINGICSLCCQGSACELDTKKKWW